MVDGGCGGFDCGGGYGVGVGVGLTEEGKKRKEEAAGCSIFGSGFEKEKSESEVFIEFRKVSDGNWNGYFQSDLSELQA
ncbi:unnamed protein product [Prunus armeniaca]